jgi:hypothetical protein
MPAEKARNSVRRSMNHDVQDYTHRISGYTLLSKGTKHQFWA